MSDVFYTSLKNLIKMYTKINWKKIAIIVVNIIGYIILFYFVFRDRILELLK